VVMDRQTTMDGRVGGYHNARYAALNLKGRKIEIFRFTDSQGRSSWYNAKGESVVKSLLRTPIHAARITSGYGMRKHPIMGFSKMHRGVDFGAAIGTPILAAGDGVVSFRGWKSGYGNYVQIRHNNTYSTAYGHISRFGNIRVGGRVKQGQVIAFVGSTGMSTGPHLHYEVMQNGRQVNPTAQRFNTSQALAGAELQKFKSRQGAILQELASLRNAGSQQVASR
jgi:murein DD-endopeptidase MepM/ murein hydrolase activator NlpD